VFSGQLIKARRGPVACRLDPSAIYLIGTLAGFNKECHAILDDLGETTTDRQHPHLASLGYTVVKDTGFEDRDEGLVPPEDAELPQKPWSIKLGDLFENHAALGGYYFQVQCVSHALDPLRAGQAAISRPRSIASSMVPTM